MENKSHLNALKENQSSKILNKRKQKPVRNHTRNPQKVLQDVFKESLKTVIESHSGSPMKTQ